MDDPALSFYNVKRKLKIIGDKPTKKARDGNDDDDVTMRRECCVCYSCFFEENEETPPHLMCSHDHLCCAKCIAAIIHQKQNPFKFQIVDDAAVYVDSMLCLDPWIIPCPCCRALCNFGDGDGVSKKFVDTRFSNLLEEYCCANDGCDEKNIPRNALLEHHIFCNKAMFPCKFCDTQCTQDSTQSHLNNDCLHVPF